MNILLIGTSAFAVPAFEALASDERFSIVGVITQPDAPHGRAKVMTPTPVAQWALANNLPLLKPESLKDENFISEIKNLKADVMLLAAYGRIIPQWMIDLAPHGIINIHPSLLPRHRGPSPVQYTILEGDETAGVSIMKIDAELDHGPILNQSTCSLDYSETTSDLLGVLAQQAAEVIPQVFVDIAAGTIQETPQVHSEATFTKLIQTSDGELRFSESAIVWDRKLRALQDEPGTFLFFKGKRMKVRNGMITEQQGDTGTFFSEDDILGINTAEGALLVCEVQPEGKPWMSAADFLRGVTL